MLQPLYTSHPYQHHLIRRIRIDDFIVTLHSSETYKNVWRIVARYKQIFASCIRRLSCPQYCPEPKNDEEKELQEEEDDKYVHGRIQYAPISSRF